MILIVEDGSGVSGANTYVDVDYVDTFCLERGFSEWFDLTDDEKKIQIIKGKDYIESFTYYGNKTDRDNSLRWPRINCYNYQDHYSIDSDEIPVQLKNGQSQACYEETINTDVLMPNYINQDPGIASKRIDVLSTSYFKQNGYSNPARNYLAKVMAYIKPFIRSAATVELLRG